MKLQPGGIPPWMPWPARRTKELLSQDRLRKPGGAAGNDLLHERKWSLALALLMTNGACQMPSEMLNGGAGQPVASGRFSSTTWKELVSVKI